VLGDLEKIGKDREIRTPKLHSRPRSAAPINERHRRSCTVEHASANPQSITSVAAGRSGQSAPDPAFGDLIIAA
jgi:hypothetical protein